MSQRSKKITNDDRMITMAKKAWYEETEEERKMREKLLEEERRLRAKQPIPWTKSRYRAYAYYLEEKTKIYKKKGRNKIKNLTWEEYSELKQKVINRLRREKGSL